jgi:hypothetical protein
VLKPLSFQELRGIGGREMHRLFHIPVKKSGQLSTFPIRTVTPIGDGVIYNQPFNASLLILWSGGISYVRPFFGGKAAWGSVSWSTPLAKML